MQSSTVRVDFEDLRLRNPKRFARKPSPTRSQLSSRSSSRDSCSSFKEIYIKNHRHAHLMTPKKAANFFDKLAEQSTNTPTIKKNTLYSESSQSTNKRSTFGTQEQQSQKTRTLKQQLKIKDQQIGLISSQCLRYKLLWYDEKQCRLETQAETIQIKKQLKHSIKQIENLKLQLRRQQQQKQYLQKQIVFLQRISLDPNDKNLHTYKQEYLEKEVLRLKQIISESKTDRELLLEHQLTKIKQKQYTLQSHYKALKLTNQCLIKQLANEVQTTQELILNSELYTKLKDKYIILLKQYKKLRQLQWATQNQLVKIQNNHNKVDDQSLLELTLSEIETSINGGISDVSDNSQQINQQ